jgi:hypothetical protein
MLRTAWSRHPDHQGCYGLQKQLTICKFADTISKFLQMESCQQTCKSAILPTIYLGGKYSPGTAVFWLPLFLPRGKEANSRAKSVTQNVGYDNNCPTRF